MFLKNMKIHTLIISWLAVTLGACDSSGRTGIFVDSPVAGLGYVAMPSETSGVTDADGHYNYENGDTTITFSLGGLAFGNAVVDGILSPIDLIEGGNSSDTRVLNITRTLMMLDSDGNPDNGISISSSVQTVADTWTTPDFSSTNFDTDITDILSDVQSADGRTPALPDAATAQAHLESSLRCQYSGMFKGSFTGTKQGWYKVYDGKVRFVVDGSGDVDGVFRGEGDWLLPSATTPLTLDTHEITASFNYTGYLFSNLEGTLKYVQSCAAAGLPCLSSSTLNITYSDVDAFTGTSSATWSDGVSANTTFTADRYDTGMSNVMIRGVSTADWEGMGATSGLFLIEVSDNYEVRILANSSGSSGSGETNRLITGGNAVYDPASGTVSGDILSGSIDLSAGTFTVNVEGDVVSGSACSLN